MEVCVNQKFLGKFEKDNLEDGRISPLKSMENVWNKKEDIVHDRPKTNLILDARALWS